MEAGDREREPGCSVSRGTDHAGIHFDMVFLRLWLIELEVGSRTVEGSAVFSSGISEPSIRPKQGVMTLPGRLPMRSEERRVGEEWRSRGSPDHLKKKK